MFDEKSTRSQYAHYQYQAQHGYRQGGGFEEWYAHKCERAKKMWDKLVNAGVESAPYTPPPKPTLFGIESAHDLKCTCEKCNDFRARRISKWQMWQTDGAADQLDVLPAELPIVVGMIRLLAGAPRTGFSPHSSTIRSGGTFGELITLCDGWQQVRIADHTNGKRARAKEIMAAIYNALERSNERP